MRFLIFALSAILLSSQSFAQYKIEGTIAGYLNSKLVLLEYFGDKHTFSDSTHTDGNGWFSFSVDEDAPAGLYSIAIANRPVFNFIFNSDDITLKFDPSQGKAPEFIFSVENLIYYDYLVKKDTYSRKAVMLKDILQYYPVQDTFYTYAETHFHRLQASLRVYTDRVISQYPGTLAAHIIRSDRPVPVPGDIDWDHYLDFNRFHYLDGVDFGDTLLINTNVLTAKAIDYL